MKSWIIARLKEESTWRGIVQVTFGTACLYAAVFRTPMFATQIAGAALVIIGIINGVKNSTDPPKP